jgi:hypothetical protein
MGESDAAIVRQKETVGVTAGNAARIVQCSMRFAPGSGSDSSVAFFSGMNNTVN